MLKDDVSGDLGKLMEELGGPSKKPSTSQPRPRPTTPPRPRPRRVPRSQPVGTSATAISSAPASESPAEPTHPPDDPIIPHQTESPISPPSTRAPLAPLSQAAQAAIANATTPSEPSPKSLPSASYIPCPSNAAQWFADAHTSVTKVDLGCHYQAVIAAWIRMEAASRYEHSPTNLSPKLRPKQVSSWIGHSRRGPDPLVENPTEYAEQWQKWWDSLQPNWRKRGGDGRWIAEHYGANGREWGPLYRWGVNGVLSVVASLFFWGCAVHSQADNRGTWETAVLDVVWMLEGMAAYYEMFKGKF
ncbi:hypothetical protein R3P38DRAFT_3224673 [Favolaschia claudopus]|uniref:Uncharacterized protein n=1 Tax=Favolaschia claudopus TaxID=2862362 RepID=A0AAV9ZVI6_9AGAR